MFSEKSQIIVGFIIICTLLLMILLLFISLITQKYKQKQVDFNVEINQLKSFHETELLKSKIEVQDHTFQKISREIHDNVGQKLSLTKLQITKIIEKSNLASDESLIYAMNNLTDCVTDLRDLSRSLSADYIISNGLIKAIENEIAQLNRTGLHLFKLSVIGERIFIKVENEIVVFRILQESLQNIIKHAKSTKVDLAVHYTPNLVSFTVADNGKGFDLSEVKDANGLTNIKKRAESIEATVNIQSSPGKGTIITLNMPINE